MSLHCVEGSIMQPIPIQNGSLSLSTKTKIHAIKVFIPGLVRSDLAFIHRVVGTIRPWREYTTSLRRLYDMEDAFLQEQPKKERALLSPYEMAVLQRGTLHPALEWWREKYLIRNFATRRFAFIWSPIKNCFPIQMKLLFL